MLEIFWNNLDKAANFLVIIATLWGIIRSYHKKLEKRFDLIDKKFEDFDKKYDGKCTHINNRIDDLYHLIVTYLFKEKVQ